MFVPWPHFRFVRSPVDKHLRTYHGDTLDIGAVGTVLSYSSTLEFCKLTSVANQVGFIRHAAYKLAMKRFSSRSVNGIIYDIG